MNREPPITTGCLPTRSVTKPTTSMVGIIAKPNIETIPPTRVSLI